MGRQANGHALAVRAARACPSCNTARTRCARLPAGVGGAEGGGEEQVQGRHVQAGGGHGARGGAAFLRCINAKGLGLGWAALASASQALRLQAPALSLAHPSPRSHPPRAAQPSPEALSAAQQAGAIDKAVGQLSSRFDDRLGGFGGAPKFPRPAELNLLLHQHARLVAAGQADAAGARAAAGLAGCEGCPRQLQADGEWLGLHSSCPYILLCTPPSSPCRLRSRGAAPGDLQPAAHGGGGHA